MRPADQRRTWPFRNLVRGALAIDCRYGGWRGCAFQTSNSLAFGNNVPVRELFHVEANPFQ
jgi:hypothetical protein